MEIFYFFLFIILLILFVISYLQCGSKTFNLHCGTVEHYEERIGGTQGDDIDDLYDSEFVDIYETVYRDLTDVKNVVEPMKSKCLDNIANEQDIHILVGGCGVNKLGGYLKKSYENVKCVDKSGVMLEKAQKLHPECKYIRGDLLNRKLFGEGEFSHIVLDERFLNYHTKKDMEKIIGNCNYWLKDQGFLVTPIYHNEKLGVGARYYSMNYMDDKGNLHGFTYLNDFHHDCYYLEGKEKNHYEYFDKIVLDTKEKRIKKTDFYFYPKEDMYNMIVKRYFKIFATEPYVAGKQVVGGYDTVIFRKERSKMDVEEIQKKFE
jgi:hypothetical protein